MCTLSDNESPCLAGIGMLISIIVGIAVMAYVFFIVKPNTISDISQILQTFAIYHSSAMVTGCTGKIATNFAEKNNERQSSSIS